MPSPAVRISITCAVDPTSFSCISRRIPLVIANAIISEATPAITPITEISVITPTTACRRFARRYRAAMNSSNRIPLAYYHGAMKHGPLLVAAILLGLFHTVSAQQSSVFPGKDWVQTSPAAVGWNAKRTEEAANYATQIGATPSC